ncbi:MAG: rRNA maturation RNase YbeY [Oscillospiraceae bacterium]|nr:rRNA maturation RNase YbeY [Oscillospiraceae bacterium]
MIKHKIYVRHHSKINFEDRLRVSLIKGCVRTVLGFEGVDMPCEVSVLITDDASIRAINFEFRGIDEPTDVLSFPMLVFSPPGWADPGSNAVDLETGLTALGEIVLSAERVRVQALEYNQSVERETAYLTVHSGLHLLGYDHLDEAGEKMQMRLREKQIMRELGF